jgi:hypothetical protein
MPIGQLRPKRIREALRKRQREVTSLQQQIVPRELTPSQKKIAGKLPQVRVVSQLGTGIGKMGKPETRVGLSTFREPDLPKPARLLLWALGAKPERAAKISLRARNVPATVRHELAHQVMNIRGVPSKEHEPIIAKARVSRKEGVSFRLLEPTRAAIRFGGTSETKRRRAQLREAKRGIRRGS